MIYRSTETIDYLRCPALWALKRQGWAPRGWGTKEVGGAVGHGIHVGTDLLDEYDTIEERVARLPVAIETAQQDFAEEIAQYEGEPSTKIAGERVRKAPALIADVLTMYAESNPFAAHGLRVVESELRCAASTIDRVVVAEPDLYGIADIKTKTFPKTNPDYYARSFAFDFAESWQMKQYLYEFTLKTGIPTNSVYLVLVDLETVTARVVPYFVSDDVQAAWLRDAQQAWADIEACVEGTRHPYRVDNHRTQYGLCEMHGACFAPEVMHMDYTNVGRNLYAKEE